MGAKESRRTCERAALASDDASDPRLHHRFRAE